jgi:TP901 family phage tail tape measure protein
MASSLGKAILEIVTDASQFFTGLGQVDTRIKTTAAGLRKVGGDMSSVGRQLTAGVTLPLAAVAAGAAKIGSDFESSFAGVRKTVNATEPEFQALAQGFRDLAKEIPVNVNELNAIGESAGQLGIHTQNIVDFTKVVAELGVATNLSSDQAASSLARMANITQLPQDQFDRLGAAIVGLGNNFATSESEIVDFGLRIAGAGHLAGLSQADILGIGTAMSSVGVEAEAGGTSVQKVLLGMVSAIASGGPKLEAFAATAGMTGAQFKTAFQADAGAAFAAFVRGLGTQGDQAITTLNNLGLGDQRVIRSFLSLAGAGDLVTRAMQQSNTEWSANTALTNEAEKRFGTTASQLQILGNNLTDLAIDLWPTLRQVVSDFLGVAKDLLPVIHGVVEWFIGLPQPAKDSIVAIAGLAAALGPILVIVGQIAIAFGALLPYLPALGEAAAALGTAMTGPIGLIVAAVVGLGLAWHTWGDDITAVVTTAYTDVKTWLWDNLQPVLEPLIGLVQSVGAAWDAFSKLVGAVVGAVIDWHIKLVETVTLWLVDKLQPIFGPLGEVIRGLQRIFGTVKDAVVTIAQRLYEGVKSWLLDKFVGIVDGIKAHIDAVTGFFNAMYEKVVGHSYVVDLWNGISAQFGRAIPEMVNPSKSSTDLVAGHFGQLQTTVGGTVSQLWSGVSSAFGTGFDSLVSGTGSMRDRLVSIFSDLQGKVMGIVNSLVSSLVSRFVTGFMNILTGAGSFSSAFTGILGGGVSAGVSAGATAGAGAGAGGAAGAGALGTVGTIGAEFAFPLVAGHLVNPGPLVTPPVSESQARAAAEAYFGPDYERYAGADFDWTHVYPGQIPGLANGGIVDQPMLAAIAERGRPEAVIPLDQIGRYLGSDRDRPLQVFLDGKTLARNQVRYIPRELFGLGY